jgi:hypothetical protein
MLLRGLERALLQRLLQGEDRVLFRVEEQRLEQVLLRLDERRLEQDLFMGLEPRLLRLLLRVQVQCPLRLLEQGLFRGKDSPYHRGERQRRGRKGRRDKGVSR